MIRVLHMAEGADPCTHEGRPAIRFVCDTCDAVWIWIGHALLLVEGNALCTLPTVAQRWNEAAQILSDVNRFCMTP